jgi:hypothetical protein
LYAATTTMMSDKVPKTAATTMVTVFPLLFEGEPEN